MNADEMPPPPSGDTICWEFHDWVLNTQGWNAYRNKYGVPIELGQVGAPLWQADAEFSMDALSPVCTDAEVISFHRPRYGDTIEHDYEAGVSTGETVDGFASVLFGAPPPSMYPPTWGQDSWDIRTQLADAQSSLPFDPWGDGTSMQHMYTEAPAAAQGSQRQSS